MPTNNENNDAFDVATLADFAKNCNVISSQQFEGIVSEKTKSLDPSVFKAQKIPDHKFYDKTSNNFEDLKQAINNTVFVIFLRSLLKDLNFAARMAKTIFSLQKGLLSTDALKTIILDNVRDSINDIVVRIANGEQLTEEDVEKIIEGSVLASASEIASDAENLAKTNMFDGLSAATLFPQLALSQRTKGLRWRPIKGATLSPKSIERLKKTTKQIKKVFEQAKGALRTARAIISLLKKLESIYNNGLIGILQSISKIVFSYVRDIGSSGVYMLDMIEPYIEYDLNIIKNQDPKKKTARMGELLRRKIKNEKIISTYEYMNNDIVSSTPFVSDWIIDTNDEDKEFIKKQQEYDKLLETINSIYKPTTYASFIQIIADSFMDDGDVATSLSSTGDNFSAFGITMSAPPNREEVEKSTINYFANLLPGNGLNNVRPGRPVFGRGSNATVVIVAFSIPNIINIANVSVGFVRSISLLLSFFQKQTSIETIKFWEDQHPFMKRLNRFWGKVTSAKLYDYYNEKPSVNEINNRIEINDGRTSQDPDFYGVAVRNLFPAFFKWLDVAEYRIDKLMRNFKSALSKEIDNILKNIEELIDDLEYFIDIIDTIISFFETLTSMGLYTLSFTSNGGNDDIVEKLLAAEGFPGVAEGDKLRMIGGYVFCYGLPNPSPANIDFIGIIKQKMAAIGYETAVARYESSGDSKDDPGSFEDYLSSERIGPNYGSSLDKIFKKLF